MDLGEDQAALDRSEQRGRQPVGIGTPPQLAPLVHGPQALANGFLPLVEAGRKVTASVGVGLGKLAGEGGERAAALAVELALDPYEQVSPGPQRLHAVEAAEVGLLATEDGPGLMRDHRPDQGLLVAEVVVQLRRADPGGPLHVLPAGPGHAALEHQVSGHGHDPVPGHPPLSGEDLLPSLAYIHPTTVASQPKFWI